MDKDRLYILDGPDKGRSFALENNSIYRVGRSPDNQIHLSDTYVSRSHLKILKRGDRYFIQDLNSKNGTSVDGELIDPGVEIEVREGVPIVIGISVICLGKRCLEEVKALLDSIAYPQSPRKIEGKDTVLLTETTAHED
jgi:pSer/pThr/pTyr-binding forkhead associated (FHA) protein